MKKIFYTILIIGVAVVLLSFLVLKSSMLLGFGVALIAFGGVKSKGSNTPLDIVFIVLATVLYALSVYFHCTDMLNISTILNNSVCIISLFYWIIGMMTARKKDNS